MCSGIEAASVAWHSLGWTPAALSEIEPFPCAVLAHHYPAVPNLGDMTKWREWPGLDIDILVGGTPCQSFSVAGLRKGLDDDRGNLTLIFCEIAERYDPAVVVWENVPGVLSDATNGFGSLLAGLVGEDAPLVPGRGGWTDAGVVAGPRRVAAWRVLDAQGFVPQRRRRVFVVASRDVDRLDPVRVLFEAEADAFACLGERAYTGPLFPVAEGVRGDSAAGGEAGEGVAPSLAARTRGGGELGTDAELDGALLACDVADSQTVGANQTTGFVGDCVAHALKAEGFDGSEDGTGRGRGVPIIPEVCGTLSDGAHMGGGLTDRTLIQDELSRCLNAGGQGRQDWETETFVVERTGGGFDDAIPFDTTQITSKANHSNPQPGDPSHPLAAGAHVPAIAIRTANTGANGHGVAEDVAHTLDQAQGQAIAFSCKDHGADAGEISTTLRSMEFDASHANGGGQVAVAFKASHYTRGKDGAPDQVVLPISADADKGDQDTLVLAKTKGVANGRMGSGTQEGESVVQSWAVRDLREREGGSSPQELQLEGSRAREPAASLSKLSHQGSSLQQDVSDLRCQAQGSGVLREALPAGEDARRPDDLGVEHEASMQGSGVCGHQPRTRAVQQTCTATQAGDVRKAANDAQREGEETMGGRLFLVRRLTVTECARLQGFPDDYLDITVRGKPAADGPKYRALGNSMAVPVMNFIGRQIVKALS